MPFAKSNDFITGRKPVPTPAGAEVLAVRFTLALGTADLALNTIGQIGVLPAGCIPVEVQVDGTDMDAGAAAKVRGEGKSLLPIGMTAVEGEFSRGDVIAVRDESGAELARGLANYASAEARLLCRKPSAEFERLLGYALARLQSGDGIRQLRRRPDQVVDRRKQRTVLRSRVRLSRRRGTV